MGTVFGIYDEPLPAPGSALVASGWVLYGPITTMACAQDGSVTKYELTGGERTVVEEDVTLPDDPLVYGFGGRVPHWHDDFREYVRVIESNPDHKLRYGGAMIGDVNQVLTYGGIFAYPALEDNPVENSACSSRGTRSRTSSKRPAVALPMGVSRFSRSNRPTSTTGCRYTSATPSLSISSRTRSSERRLRISIFEVEPPVNRYSGPYQLSCSATVRIVSTATSGETEIESMSASSRNSVYSGIVEGASPQRYRPDGRGGGPPRSPN